MPSKQTPKGLGRQELAPEPFLCAWSRKHIGKANGLQTVFSVLVLLQRSLLFAGTGSTKHAAGPSCVFFRFHRCGIAIKALLRRNWHSITAISRAFFRLKAAQTVVKIRIKSNDQSTPCAFLRFVPQYLPLALLALWPKPIACPLNSKPLCPRHPKMIGPMHSACN